MQLEQGNRSPKMLHRQGLTFTPVICKLQMHPRARAPGMRMTTSLPGCSRRSSSSTRGAPSPRPRTLTLSLRSPSVMPPSSCKQPRAGPADVGASDGRVLLRVSTERGVRRWSLLVLHPDARAHVFDASVSVWPRRGCKLQLGDESTPYGIEILLRSMKPEEQCTSTIPRAYMTMLGAEARGEKVKNTSVSMAIHSTRVGLAGISCLKGKGICTNHTI